MWESEFLEGFKEVCEDDLGLCRKCRTPREMRSIRAYNRFFGSPGKWIIIINYYVQNYTFFPKF